MAILGDLKSWARSTLITWSLDLPHTVPSFHGLLVKSCYPASPLDSESPPATSPEPLEIDGQPTYTVKDLLHSHRRGVWLQYLVDWETMVQGLGMWELGICGGLRHICTCSPQQKLRFPRSLTTWQNGCTGWLRQWLHFTMNTHTLTWFKSPDNWLDAGPPHPGLYIFAHLLTLCEATVCPHLCFLLPSLLITCVCFLDFDCVLCLWFPRFSLIHKTELTKTCSGKVLGWNGDVIFFKKFPFG